MTIIQPTRDHLSARSRGWPVAPRRPRMANQEDARAGLELTSQAILRNGLPWIPVSGEIHYSRVPRERWAERLHQLRSGGITVVACYVPWIHHAAVRGEPRFDENLDVAAFVDLVRAESFELVLRIGPWAHGELRNGGFPDWLQAADVAHRTNDPAYLDLVREWWAQLAAALGHRLSPDVLLAIQLENELYDAPEHISELKSIARELGFSAPFWTSTAWGGARLPDPEVFPVYGGYGDGFWVDPDAPWDPSFRQHYFFSHRWDDPGIGADLRNSPAGAIAGGLESPWFPAATCELGSGMATAYHRRRDPSALDVAAIAHIKVGNGSSWQGYYMYAGGQNPPGGLQESHATGYPNDMPVFDYDFHAPVGSAGRLASSHAALRRQHAFLQAFGPRLGAMPSHLPHVVPDSVDDGETLRWALRGDGDSGFLFISWHQPLVPLPTYRGATFRVGFDHREVTLPSTPVDVPPGTIACWPVGIEVGGVRIEWLTATPLTVLDGDVPVLVVVENADVPVEIALADGATLDGVPAEGPVRFDAGLSARRVEAVGGGRFDLVVIPAALASDVWVPTGVDGRARRVVLSSDEVRWTVAGRLTVLSPVAAPEVMAMVPGARGFTTVALSPTGRAHGAHRVRTTSLRSPDEQIPVSYGTFGGRPSAPSHDVVEASAAVCGLDLPEWAPEPDATLRIDWAGDVAALRVDGRINADRFWDGSPWFLSPHDIGVEPGSTVELLVLPLSSDSAVHVPASADLRRRGSSNPLCAIDDVVIVHRATWIETDISPSRSNLEEDL